MKKILISAVVLIVPLAGLSYAAEEDINAPMNADKNSSVSTSMNGDSTTTNSGVPISSTSASQESRSASGSSNP